MHPLLLVLLYVALIVVAVALILGAGYWLVLTVWDFFWDVGGEWQERIRRWRG